VLQRIFVCLICVLVPILAALPASADMRLGIIAPEEGAFEPLGRQVLQALSVFGEINETAFADMVLAPEGCEEGAGAEAAVSMVEAGVDMVIGFFCPETIVEAAPILAASNIAAMTIAVRSEIVMEEPRERGWPFFRIAPQANDEIEVIVDTIMRRWSGEAFALIEDGTIYGRETVEAVRLALEELGVQPIFVDNFRPAQEKQFGLVRRLRRADATHVFVGGDRSDVAIIASNAREIGFDMQWMGGSPLLAADGDTPLPDGVMAIIASAESQEPRALDVAQAFEARGFASGGYALAAYAAIEIAATAIQLSERDEEPVSIVLERETFHTVLGPIRFDDDHERTGNQYRATIWQDGLFQTLDP